MEVAGLMFNPLSSKTHGNPWFRYPYRRGELSQKISIAETLEDHVDAAPRPMPSWLVTLRPNGNEESLGGYGTGSYGGPIMARLHGCTI